MSSKKFKTLDGLTSTGNVAFGDDTFVVDVTTDRVGINKSDPQTALDIDGTVAATLFSGDGSELTSVDASTLGSLANTDFLRSNASTSFSTGNFNFSSSGTLTFTNGTLRLNDNRTLRLGSVNTPGFSMSFDGTSKMIVQGFGTNAETEIISAAGTSIRRATNTQPIKIQGNNTTNNNTATITSENLTANITFTLPNVTNSSFIMSEGTQVINGNKTFTNALTLSTAGTATNHAVRADRSISAGNGLTGGGNFTTNRSINVGAANGISVSTTAVAVNAGNGIIANTSGVHTAGMVTSTTDTGVASTTHKRVIIASENSRVLDEDLGAVIASEGSVVSESRCAVIASRNSQARESKDCVVLACRESIADGGESAVIASRNSLSQGGNCLVIASNGVRNFRGDSVAMGVGSGNASIENRKIHLFSNNGNIYNDGELRFGNLNWSSSTPAGGWALSVTGGVAANNTNNGDLRFLDGTSERVRFTNNGDIQATGDITAGFSDERLKTFKGKIESPLEKINSLNGYHYELNELAESFGYSADKQYVGLSAQEVEAVLPEIVSLAPFDIESDENGNKYSKSGENYKTVDYNKLTALLIEGIKEQQNEIQQLKETVNQLKSILNK